MLRLPCHMLLATLILLSGCAKEVDSASEFFPLVDGSEYTYRGVFESKETTKTVIVKSYVLPDGGPTIFYFADKSKQNEQNPSIGSHMFGLGSYFFDNTGLWTIKTFWKNDLQKVDLAQKQLLLNSTLTSSSPNTLAGEHSNPIQTISFERFEDVSVAAGSFPHCAKMKILERWDGGKEYVSFVWLARGVGMVRWRRGTGRVDELIGYQ